jgi:hypothetical protein
MKKLQILKIKNDVILKNENKKNQPFIIYGWMTIIPKIRYKESLLIGPYY